MQVESSTVSYHHIISAQPTNQNIVEISGFGSNQFDVLSIGKGVVSADSNNAKTSSTAIIHPRCCLAPRRNVASRNVILQILMTPVMMISMIMILIIMIVVMMVIKLVIRTLMILMLLVSLLLITQR